MTEREERSNKIFLKNVVALICFLLTSYTSGVWIAPKRLGRTQLSDSLSRLLHVVVVSPPIYLLNYCTYRSQQKMIDLVIGVVEAKQKNQSQKTNNIGTV